MKNFLKYSALGLMMIVLVVVFGPMIGGLLFGAAIAVGGYWLFERTQSMFIKLVGVGIMLSGGMVALGSIPGLVFLFAPVIGYYVYQWWQEREHASTTSAFDHFEKEWQKLSK